MPRPYIVSTYATDYTSAGTSKSVSVSCEDGDTLVVIGTGGKNTTINAPTATGITFSAGHTSAGDATYGLLRTGYALRVSKQTNLSISVTESGGTLPWGFTCLVIRNCFSVSLSSILTGTGTSFFATNPTYVRALTVPILVDSAANDGAARVWRTVEGFAPTAGNGYELTYQRVTSNFTVYTAAYPVTNQIGQAVSVFLSSPSTTYKIGYLHFDGDDSPIMRVSSQFMVESYAATTSRSNNYTEQNLTPKTLLLATAYVGVQPANGTDSSITTSMTAGGVPMTSLAKIHSNGGTQGYVEVFYLKNPPRGSSTSVQLTSSSSVDLRLGGIAVINNIDQHTPFLDIVTASNSSTSPSLSFNPISTNRPTIYAVAISGSNITGTSRTAGSHQIENSSENYNNLSDGGCASAVLVSNPQSAQTVSWTLASSAPWAAIGVVLNPTSYTPPYAVSGFIA